MRPEYTGLLAVSASSPEALQRNLAALCSPQVLNLSEHEAKEQEVQVAAALSIPNSGVFQ